MIASSAIQVGVVGTDLIEHGSRIAGIVFGAALLYLFARHALPRALKTAVATARKGEVSEGELQRAETLSRVLVHTTEAIILTKGFARVNLNVSVA
jgi:hypothetical protein